MRLFEHYCKILLTQWIRKNEHQNKKRKKIKEIKRIKRCKLCLPCAWCDYFIFLWVLLDELEKICMMELSLELGDLLDVGDLV